MDHTDPSAPTTTIHRPMAWTADVTPESAWLLVGQLCQAIETRDLIGQAKGIVMAQRGVDAAAAFAVLVECSNRTNTPLRLIVQTVVDSTTPVASTPQQVDRRPGSQ